MKTARPIITPEHAIRVGAVYLVALVLACVTFWCVVLLGGNPFKVNAIASVNASGVAQAAFRAGDLVSIRRVVCSERDISTQFRPYLTSDLGQFIPMLGGVTRYQTGCHQYGYAFVMPSLPPGRYTFDGAIIYAVNLVGRDEFFHLPSIVIEVRP